MHNNDAIFAAVARISLNALERTEPIKIREILDSLIMAFDDRTGVVTVSGKKPDGTPVISSSHAVDGVTHLFAARVSVAREILSYRAP